MSEVRYCANGCTRLSAGERIPATTEPPSNLCNRCEENLKKWLTEIPDRYAKLEQFLDPDTTPNDNPDVKRGRQIHAPAPLRLEVLDLLDERRGRKWQGLAPTTDRRGTVGTLHAIATEIRDTRHLTKLVKRPTVRGEAALILKHMFWLAEQEWVADTHEELRTLHRLLGDAIGEHRPRAVGVCVVDNGEGECGGPLLPSRLGGVHCPRCGSTWDIDELRRLGLLLTQEPA